MYVVQRESTNRNEWNQSQIERAASVQTDSTSAF